MDGQTIFNLIAGTVIAAGGWFARELWGAVKELRRDLHSIEVNLPMNYVQKTDLDRRMEHIEDMFQRIYDKLDAKVDK
jgi:predicted negative regulator of RcsB-dependent stress response